MGKMMKYQTGGKTPTTPKEKSFAALAAPKNKITAADRIAGAKKSAGVARGGAKLKKQAAIAIAMKAAGKKPKKARTGATLKAKGVTASNVSKRLGSRLRAGGTLSPTGSNVSRKLASPFKNKARGGATLAPSKKSTSTRLASNLKMKTGGRMKKCRGGCY